MKRFSLSERERIKSRKLISKLFTEGNVIYSADKVLRATYLFSDEGDTRVKAAFAVSHKAGNAVWRNRIKRLLRESYRLNKYILINYCSTENTYLSVIFSAYKLNKKYNKTINLKNIMPAVTELMDKIIKQRSGYS